MTHDDIYRSIVEPHFNYCCSVWDCSGIMRIESLQKLQNRAARIVTGSSYDAPSVPLRKELGWLSVKEMIVKETSTMMYKSLNDLAPQYLSDLFLRLSDMKYMKIYFNACTCCFPLGECNPRSKLY